MEVYSAPGRRLIEPPTRYVVAHAKALPNTSLLEVLDMGREVARAATKEPMDSITDHFNQRMSNIDGIDQKLSFHRAALAAQTKLAEGGPDGDAPIDMDAITKAIEKHDLAQKNSCSERL